VAQLRQLLGSASITQPTNDTVLVVGRHLGSLPVTNNQLAIGCALGRPRAGTAEMNLHLPLHRIVCSTEHGPYQAAPLCHARHILRPRLS
jgi:hypothetical protein